MQQRIARRNCRPESGLWETEAGGAWLKRLVIAAVYVFGLQAGVGSPSLSKFFHLLGLEEVVAISPKTLERISERLCKQIAEYGEQQQGQQSSGQGKRDICVAADEMVVDGQWLLVLMELASGYILTEATVDERSYANWQQQVEGSIVAMGVQIRYLVSDQGKSLLALARHHWQCWAVADLFHGLYNFSQRGLGQEIRIQRTKLKRALGRLSQASDKRATLEEEIEHWQGISEHYEQLIRQMTLTLHPFEIERFAAQSAAQAAQRLQQTVAQLALLRKEAGLADRYNSINKFSELIPSLTSVVELWWQWSNESLSQQPWPESTKQWIRCVLLPVHYWSYQCNRTKNPLLKQYYRRAQRLATEALEYYPPDPLRTPQIYQAAEQWAEQMVRNFQRASSAVEGRNGYLAQIHHRNRGLSDTRLRALTVIHNFGIRRADGSTAAERFFANSFPDLFEWLVEQVDELPQPRRSRQSKSKAVSPAPQPVPA